MTKAVETSDPVSESIDEAMREQIAIRAHEISQSADAGSDEENWLLAERELRIDGVAGV